MHIEYFPEDGTYVLRAELPGLDAAKDIDVSAANGVLTIAAQREEAKREQHRTEFRYGSFARTASLPVGADTEKISAEYKRGVLEVRVPIAAPPEEHVGCADTGRRTQAQRDRRQHGSSGPQ
ncbi:Hsp20/alpha crystallin family protein [Lentzea sp.]|uniref:Hsp20/alpha crystallin family protein n=1 Tax=Lentzea sp. TaxID=56099 RepID=UPI002ECFB3CC